MSVMAPECPTIFLIMVWSAWASVSMEMQVYRVQCGVWSYPSCSVVLIDCMPSLGMITINIEVGVIPKFAACASQGVPWFQERGLWQDNSYEPRPGDIIFFDWDDGGRMVLPTMLVSWRRWRMAASTLSRVTPAIAAVKTVTRLVTMKSMGTEPRRIN